MNILDIILLLCFIPAIVQGVREGFIKQLISIVALIAGVWLSFEFSTLVGEWLGQYIEGSEDALKIVAFALILVVTIIGLSLVGKMIEKVFKLVMLGWLNTLLGIVFSIVKVGLVVGLLIMLFEPLNASFDLVQEDYLNSSLLYPKMKELCNIVFPYLKDILNWN